MPKRAQPEAQLQRAVCEFLTSALDSAVMWFHPANEQANEITRMRNSALGVMPGTADLIFLWYEGHGAIELKARGRKQSLEQEVWAAQYMALGGLYAVCRTPEEVEAVLRSWKLPLRASLKAKRA